jgi:hypothetical protein
MSSNAGIEKPCGSKEQTRAVSPPQDVPRARSFGELEEKHSHETDTEMDGTSSSSDASSAIEDDRRPISRRASSALSRHISISETRDGFQNQRDPELGPELTEKTTTTSPDPNDPNLVTWDGPDDPKNPKNWKFSKKWAAMFIVSLFALISPVSSSLVAPALDAIGDELGITQACKSNPVPGFQNTMVFDGTRHNG